MREHSRLHVVDHVKLVYHSKKQIESLNKHWSYYFQFFCSVSIFFGWPMHAWLFPRIDRPTRTLHWFTLIAQNNGIVRNITKEILVKDLGIVVFWNFVVTFAFYNSHVIVLLDSANPNSRSIASLQRELNAASSKFLKSNSLFDA